MNKLAKKMANREGFTLVELIVVIAILGILAGIASRGLKQAATVFTIPAIMPLVPGSRIFYTMAYLIAGDLKTAAIAGAETIFLAGAIAIGLLVTGAVINLIIAASKKLHRA